MSDPVDTDALRHVTQNEGLWEAEALLITAAADEVDRLRDRLTTQQQRHATPAKEMNVTNNEEPTVQVPVSLIEGHAAFLDRAGYTATANRMRALLSQPPPSAEQCICNTGPDTDGPDIDCPVHGLPPGIEELAPGTTFTARTYGDSADEYAVRFRKADAGLLLVQEWRRSPIFADEIDPSTIRDVTPPKEQP